MKKYLIGDFRRIRPSNLTAGAQKKPATPDDWRFPPWGAKKRNKSRKVIRHEKIQTKWKFSPAIYWKATGVLFTRGFEILSFFRTNRVRLISPAVRRTGESNLCFSFWSANKISFPTEINNRISFFKTQVRGLWSGRFYQPPHLPWVSQRRRRRWQRRRHRRRRRGRRRQANDLVRWNLAHFPCFIFLFKMSRYMSAQELNTARPEWMAGQVGVSASSDFRSEFYPFFNNGVRQMQCCL